MLKRWLSIAFVVVVGVLSGRSASAADEEPITARQRGAVHGEAGLGLGQTMFFGDTKENLAAALGKSFSPGLAGNFALSFYYAPRSWAGLGVGARTKISGSPGPQKRDGDDFFFNYYHAGLSGKYHAFGMFNQGPYARLTVGVGQLTTKRANDARRDYVHQFAIGGVAAAGLGYAVPVGASAINVDMEFEMAWRNGTIAGKGDGQTFQSGQLGVMLAYSF